MALILCIETSSINCSVALFESGTLIEVLESAESYAHSQKLHPFMEEVIKTSGKLKSDIQAVLLGSGPGSFTGLRIGSAAAKGLCYGLSVPMMSVSSLENMSIGIQKIKKRLSLPEKHLLCPLIDARRMEVYSCMFDQDMNLLQEADAVILDESTFIDKLEENTMVFFGDGMEKMKSMYESHENARFVNDILPTTMNFGEIAESKFNQKEFENIAYFEPFYLKGFVPTTPKKLL